MKYMVFGIAAMLLLMPSLHGFARDFQLEHIINRDSDCANDSGNEVNGRVTVTAPDGMFFEKESIQVYPEADMRSFSDAAGPSGCFLQNIKSELYTVNTKAGNEVKISLVKSFEVYGHSDCGSGTARTLQHIALGNRIRTHCSVKAQIYSKDDLK